MLKIEQIKSVKGDNNEKTLVITSTKAKLNLQDVTSAETHSGLILELAKKAASSNKLSSSTTIKTSLGKSDAPNVEEEDPLELVLQDWSVLLMGTTANDYSSDEIVIRANENVDQMFYLVRGSCKVSRLENGNNVDLAVLAPDSFFGEMSFLEDIKTTANVTAIEPCEITQLHRDKLHILFKRSSFLAAKFFKYLSEILTERYQNTLRNLLIELN